MAKHNKHNVFVCPKLENNGKHNVFCPKLENSCTHNGVFVLSSETTVNTTVFWSYRFATDLPPDRLVMVFPLNSKFANPKRDFHYTTIFATDRLVLVSPLNRILQIRNAIFITQRYCLSTSQYFLSRFARYRFTSLTFHKVLTQFLKFLAVWGLRSGVIVMVVQVVLLVALYY